MTPKQFSQICLGDLVRHVGEDKAYIVVRTSGKDAIATRSEHLTNPGKWVFIGKAHYVQPEDHG